VGPRRGCRTNPWPRSDTPRRLGKRFEDQLRRGFEVRKDNTVRGLVTQFSGLAQRHKDGSIGIKAVRPADLGPLDLPWQVSIVARIGIKGDLIVKDYGGVETRGYCRSVI
jgi:hypothetical protein